MTGVLLIIYVTRIFISVAQRSQKLRTRVSLRLSLLCRSYKFRRSYPFNDRFQQPAAVVSENYRTASCSEVTATL